MGDITKPRISLDYLITVMVFVLMIGVGTLLFLFLKGKAAAVVSTVSPAAGNVISSINVPSGNPNAPTK